MIDLLLSLKEKQISIQLNGLDQLEIMAPKGIINKQLLDRIKAGKTELVNFLKKKKEYIPLKSVEKREYYPVSSAQKRLLLINQIDGQATNYNMYNAWVIEGPLDKDKLEKCFNTLVKRHESLHTLFTFKHSEPIQKTNKNFKFSVEYNDISEIDLNKSKEIWINKYIKNFIRPFNLSITPLLRVGLVKLSSDKHILIHDMHHVISDGVSNAILINEFIKLYYGEELSELKICYNDYVYWQNRQKNNDYYIRQKKYWIEQFKGELPLLDLPTDNLRPSLQTFEGKTYQFEIAQSKIDIIKSLNAQEGTTLFMFLLSAFYTFLSKISGQEDIIIGIPIEGRRHIDSKNIIGMFVNTLALRAYTNRNKSFKEFLHQVRSLTLESFQNQDYQFEELLKQLEFIRDASRNPLFDVMFVLQNFERKIEKKLDGLKISQYQQTATNSKFDLTLLVLEEDEKVYCMFEYASKLFNESTIIQFSKYFLKIVDSVIMNRNQNISRLEIIDTEEKNTILYKFNKTKANFPKEKKIYDFFEEQVIKTPNKIALQKGDNFITYEKLNSEVNLLANYLIDHGVRENEPIVLITYRSIRMMIGIFGILKSGACYLPIDPEIPAARINYILNDSKVNFIITTKDINKHYQFDKNIVYLDKKNAQPNVFRGLRYKGSSKDLAYIIYTSGSTGQPKGTLLENHSIVNRIFWMQKQYPISEFDILVQKTPYTFDVSVWELFWWTFQGASLYLLKKGGEKDPEYISKVIKEIGITIIHFVPSMLSGFLTYLQQNEVKDNLSSVRNIFCSGEALHIEHINQFKRVISNSTQLINLYGPTEAAVDVTYYTCDTNKSVHSIPIGKPIDNVQIFILNKSDQLQPIGLPGELCISGVALARGYLNQSYLTNEKFTLNPVSHESKIYRTGDLAKWLPDGNIEYLGRIDHQLKIRGFRIEVGEIEYQLLQHKDIYDAIVIAKSNKSKEKYLCVYYVAAYEIERIQLRNYLLEHLPEYMVPSFFTFLTEFPLSSNGKIDRKLLPEPVYSEVMNYMAPTNEIEKILVDIWTDILGTTNKRKIGITENFFLLGGDSIQMIQISASMHSKGYKLSIQDIHRYQNIKDLAKFVQKKTTQTDQSIVTGIAPLMPIQRRFFDKKYTYQNHYNQAVMLSLDKGINEQCIKAIFEKILEHHDALRTTFKKKNREFLQQIHGLDYPFDIKVFFIDNNQANEIITQNANEIQKSIDLDNGPVMKLGLFYTEKQTQLLIVIHHLVIDGVSWRILFEDINTLYNQYKKGEALLLPPKTTSIKAWFQKLLWYAESKIFSKEIAYWEKLIQEKVNEIKKDYANGSNLYQDLIRESFVLEKKYSDQLFSNANSAYGTHINDLLLISFGLALKNVFGIEKVMIDIEGHGREEIIEGMDINRTVGWFTAIYPIIVDVKDANDISKAIKNNKERLRNTPNRGIGYGIYKYLLSKEKGNTYFEEQKSRICFNYLGQFNAQKDEMPFKISFENTGYHSSMKNKRDYELDVSGMLSKNGFEMNISYSENQYKKESIQQLIESYKKSLIEVITHCVALENRIYTPSDFTFKLLSLDQIEKLQKQYDFHDIYPLSPMQEGMLFHSLYDPDSLSYFEQISFCLIGDIEKEFVERALEGIIERYDILRTIFLHDEYSNPLQLVLKKRKPNIIYLDIRKECSNNNKKSILEKYRQQDKSKKFDLLSDDLMRITLLRVGIKEYEFIWSHHHILMDGWCIAILISEFIELYHNYRKKSSLQLPAVNQYVSYINWLEKLDKESSRYYWKEYLTDFEEVITLPRFNSNNQIPFSQKEICVNIEKEGTLKLKELAGQLKITLNTLIQGAWGILLSKYNNSEDILFGSVVSGRPAEIDKIEFMVGLFINTIPVRINCSTKKQVCDFFIEIQKRAIESERHHYYPLAEIQSLSSLGVKLVDHLIIFENYPIIDHIENKNIHHQSGKENLISIKDTKVFEQTNYDFNLVVIPNEEILFRFEYNENVYPKKIIEKISDHLYIIIHQILVKKDQKISDIEITAKEEKDRILYEFNNTKKNYSLRKTIYELFEDQAEQTPDHIALIFNDEQLTYKELNKKSNLLAQFLQEKRINPNELIGLMIEKSSYTIIGILGILKSGGAYLPIDFSYPEERVNYMLADSEAKLLLTQLNCTSELSGVEKIDITKQDIYSRKFTNLKASSNSSDLAYVLYTSGSTGRPKGVLIEHKSLTDYVLTFKKYFNLTKKDIVIQQSSISFDTSVEEMYPILNSGGMLIIIKEGGKDIEAILECINTRNATILSATPMIINELNQYPEVLKKLRILISGGELLKPNHINKLINIVNIYNTYGPTESTVCATYHKISSLENCSLIGKPIQNRNIYILDKDGQIQAIGLKGEICIGGKGIARGYIKNEKLTKKAFQTSPFDQKTKIYKSGDVGRWLPDGTIEILGRSDEQVKIRGYRIELKEIEEILLKYDEIDETIVVVSDDKHGNKYLCAYYTANQEIDSNTIRSYLLKALPEYMVPSFYIKLKEFPLTPNGKFDKNALPKPEYNAIQKYIAPCNEIEKNIVAIWAEVLDIDKGAISINSIFFELGGHSLTAMKITSKIHQQLKVKVPVNKIFELQTVKLLSDYIRLTVKDKFISIKRVEKREYYPLSSAQKRMFLIHQIDSNNTQYNMPHLILLQEKVNKEKLEGVIEILLKRHESLRTSFEIIHGVPVQKVNEIINFNIEYIKSNEQNIAIIANNLIKPFDLNNEPLIRIWFIELSNSQNFLFFDLHHIISDAITQNILHQEFIDLYKESKLEPLSLQYKDYAFWQQKQSKNNLLKKQENFWTNIYSDEIDILQLPTDFSRPSRKSFEGDNVAFILEKNDTNTIKNIAKERGCTLFMTLLTVYNILLYKLTGQLDIIVGIPIAGRSHADIEKIVGLFVNTLAIRNKLIEGISICDFLEQVKKNTLKAFENQDYQFDDLIDKLNIKRDIGRNPLFETGFNLLNHKNDELTNHNNDINNNGLNILAKFDLSLIAIDSGQEIQIVFNFSTNLFKKETIVRFIGYFQKIISELMKNPNQKISNIDIIPKKEKHRLLYEFNDTKADYPQEKTLHKLFEEQCEKTPNNIAIIYNEEKITYKLLNYRANAIANKIIKYITYGDCKIGLLFEPSIELVSCILGILKCGFAYVPLSTDAPHERNKYILSDCDAKLLLVQKKLIERDPNIISIIDKEKIIVIGTDYYLNENNTNHEKVIPSNTLSYVIYTSGTTGVPKGVEIEHRGVVNFILWRIDNYKHTENDVTLQLLSYHFDGYGSNLYTSLLSGGALVLVSEEERTSPYFLIDTIKKFNITNAVLVPSIYNYILNETYNYEAIKTLRYITLAGEKAQPDLIAKSVLKYPKIVLTNEYGPTEASIGVTCNNELSKENTSVIGKPIYNTNIYIVGRNNELLPIGVKGELCIQNIGLSPGYINNKALTQAKFIECPFADGKRMYKTGDMAKWLSDGNIEFIDRIDQQVKIRGYRIELSEIETQLCKYEKIKEAIVIAKGNGDEKYLCAYIVTEEQNENKIKQNLRTKLPDYMIPSFFIFMDIFPLTQSGKIDRKSLPEPNIIENNEYIPPTNMIEDKLAKIWSEVLKIDKDKIGINANFFELGGNSLLAIMLISSINKVFGTTMSIVQVFEFQSIKKIAKNISIAEKNLYKKLLLVEKKEYYKVSPSQKRLYFVNLLNPNSINYNSPLINRIDGDLDTNKLEDCFIKLIQRHESLRTSFEQFENEPVQIIHDNVHFKINRIEKCSDVNNEIKKHIQPFNLSKPPLIKVVLISLEKNQHILFIDMHHIISDAISAQILYNDFNKLYHNKVLPKLRLQYKDYANWHFRIYKSEKIKQQEKYWLNKFEGEIPQLALPYDYERTNKPIAEGINIIINLNKDIVIKLNNLQKRTNSTVYMLFLSLFNVLLYKYSNQEDIIIGSPIAGRRHIDTNNITGMFVGQLATRNKINPDFSFQTFLLNVKSNVLTDFDNQDYQFDDLVAKLNLKTKAGQNPLFDAVFAVENIDIDNSDNENILENQNLKISPFEFEINTAKTGLRLGVFMDMNDIQLRFTYATELFKKETIEIMAYRFTEIVRQIANNPQIKIRDIKISQKLNSVDDRILQDEMGEFNF